MGKVLFFGVTRLYTGSLYESPVPRIKPLGKLLNSNEAPPQTDEVYNHAPT
jgi:hypothetical protein